MAESLLGAIYFFLLIIDTATPMPTMPNKGYHVENINLTLRLV
jgi:hypothetical protein